LIGPGSGRRTRLAVALALAVAAASCRPADEPREPNPLEAPPVDPARVGSADEVARWPLRTGLEADLDADGRTEAVVLASDVTLASDGSPLWEDGHRWAVVVEDEGRSTLLYAAFVPNGHVEAAIGIAGADGTRLVIVHERTPGRAVSYTIAYEAPQGARLVSAAYDHVERWLPPLHAR
jgi:hypothetical protein